MSYKFTILALALVLCTWQVSAQKKSACELQKEKEASNKGPLKLDVKCLPNGDYAPLQCFPSNKFCYCALPDGNQITQPSRNRKFCKCDLEKYQAEKKIPAGRDPPNGTYLPKCTRDGLYYQKQCETGTNVCWCVNQDGVQTSKDRKVGVTCS